MLSPLSLCYIQFMEVKILWGPRVGYDDQGPDNLNTSISVNIWTTVVTE